MVDNNEIFYFKEDRRFYKWARLRITLNHRGINCTINLGIFNRIHEPLLSQIKLFITRKCNSSYGTTKGARDAFKALDIFLDTQKRDIFVGSDLGIPLLTSFVSVLRDNPRIVNYKSQSACCSIFSAVRNFYRWAYQSGLQGYCEGVLDYLVGVKFSAGTLYKSLKHMDIEKGPFTDIELLVLDKFFLRKMNEWDALSLNHKCAVISYWISRETSRRCLEQSVITTDDVRQSEGNISYIKLPDRKPLNTAESSKMPLRVSNALYSLIIRYIEETSAVRQTLNTRLLFIFEGATGSHSTKSPDFLGDQVIEIVKRGNLPNRRFFTSELTLEDLESPGKSSYSLHYTPSRMRDTYGTHMALMKTPFEYLSARMGHKAVQTTQKFYIVLRPEIVSDLLSRTVGFKYAKFSEYFFDRQRARKEDTTQPVLAMDQGNSLPFGNCTGTYCNFDPRIGCYLCSRFQYIDNRNEHLRNLEWLRQKRARMMKDKAEEGADNNDPQLLMYFRQLDLAIEGAEFIVNKCTSAESR
jgi:hypothetical protein